jgi:hypothetical protein
MITTATATTVTLARVMINTSADNQQDHQQKHEVILQNTIALVENITQIILTISSQEHSSGALTSVSKYLGA